MLRRVLLVLVLGAAAALVAVSPARGDGAYYIVTGTGDAPGAACGPYPSFPGAFACDSLRAAVAAADANPGLDVIGLGTSGTFALSQGELAIGGDVSIAGPNARTTTIQGNGAARAVNVGAGVNAVFSGVTIAGGQAGTGDGGNINNAGTLSLINARVTGGAAANGGGIANAGSLLIVQSLVDHNSASVQGGGISNQGGGSTAHVSDSTIYRNDAGLGGGISSVGDGSNQVSLVHVTMAFNRARQDPGGISAVTGTWAAYGSLLVGNQGATASNCNAPATDGTLSIEDGSACNLALPSATNTGLVDGLSDVGGHTDVLAISSAGQAKGFVSPCNSGADQRSAPRSAAGACDAGAYEEGAIAPPVTGFQLPPISTPPPPPPPPRAVATPVAQQSVAGEVVSGKVRVRKPGSNEFVDLDPSQPIPLGSTIDVKQGVIKVTALLKKGGQTETAKFRDGMFKITQTKTTSDLTLNETLAKCPKASRASAGAKKPKTRKLWGDGSGSFRTRGQYSSATVRGTEWLVQDSCAGTLTRVKQGTVTVQHGLKRIILRAGKKYLARPAR